MTGWVKDTLQMIVVGAVVAILVSFVISPFTVSGGSMLPTYKDGNFVLVDKLSYKFNQPAKNDVVVMNSNKGAMIKRVIREVEPGKYWVEGDNKDQSTDSRVFGAVDRRAIVGKVIIKLW